MKCHSLLDEKQRQCNQKLMKKWNICIAEATGNKWLNRKRKVCKVVGFKKQKLFKETVEISGWKKNYANQNITSSKI